MLHLAENALGTKKSTYSVLMTNYLNYKPIIAPNHLSCNHRMNFCSLWRSLFCIFQISAYAQEAKSGLFAIAGGLSFHPTLKFPTSFLTMKDRSEDGPTKLYTKYGWRNFA